MAPRKKRTTNDDGLLKDLKKRPTKLMQKKPLMRRSTDKHKNSALFKRTLLIFMLCTILVLGFVIYIMLNKNKFLPILGHSITLSVSEIVLKPETLTQKDTRAEIRLKINNKSLFPIYLDNFIFDLNIGEYEIARNMKATTKIKLDERKEITVPIGCNVDSIMARRALQKTVEKNAGNVLKKLLSQTPAPRNAYGEDIKVISKIKGQANMHVKLFSYELPFEKKCEFN